MGLLINVALGVVHFIFVALDVAAFFLVIRLLVLRFPKAIFLTFNRVGAPLVDPMMATIARAISRTGSRQAVRARMFEALVLLASVEVFRFAITGIVYFTVRSTSGEVITTLRV